MSAATQRLTLEVAERLANEVADLLRPACRQLTIAGSIRRRQPTIGDLELVCVPAFEPDLFGGDGVNRLEARCAELLTAGTFTRRLDKNGHGAVGTRYKRLRYRDAPLDLFVVLPPTECGWLMVIRTGSAEFSHTMATLANRRGLHSQGCALHRGEQTVPTPTEADVFAAIAVPLLSPERRTETVRLIRGAWVEP